MEREPSSHPAKANKVLIGIAGVHHVVSELSRRGLVALPTTKNTAAYDIVVVNQQGTKHANIQVKASSKRATFFLMPSAEKVRAGRRDIYVFVRWLKREDRYECFLLTGRQARDAVKDGIKAQRIRIKAGTRKVEVPCVTVGKAAERWRLAWRRWRL
jgi:hypothetical protein